MGLAPWVRSLLNRAGIETARKATLHHFLRTRHIDLVVDVGANLGQFVGEIRERGYKGPLHSFEPVSKVFAALEKKAARDPSWTVTRTALGAEPGEAHINLYEFDTLNSMHSIDAGSAQRLGVDPALRGVETVPVTTLDLALAGNDATSILLKIDTQGHERAVLDGAGETLKRTSALLLELPSEKLYENIWGFSEAIAHLDALGFTPAQFRAVNTMNDDPACAMEFDCLFRRKG
ncbi:MAG: hypothetical protein DI544_10935 [Sphingomonas taxi]|uniref:Methyltransferase FkbM domain-containing protein n=1 Tax=Sphingomonas taxi TaxID=1549858 RepID=A0A2W5P1P7_9SPHN|nr:MAG: hypothetical protein DI544_10935 [Sphingomonas taxi]